MLSTIFVDKLWINWGEIKTDNSVKLVFPEFTLHYIHRDVHSLWITERKKVVGTEPNPQHDLDKKADRCSLASPRHILSLAIPALGALIIEPVLLLIDSVMVGHLGVTQLAALSAAQAVLNTLVGIFVFLAYSTTAITARLFGAGKMRQGLRAGVDALWLAFALGAALTILLEVFAPNLVSLLGADAQVIPAASAYLRFAAPGIVGMLAILAANGTLRGLLNTKTPLYVFATGAVLNVGLNVLFIYILQMGLVGAGLGLSLTQTAMASVLVAMVFRRAKTEGASLLPSGRGAFSSAATGLPLFVRTISLRIALLLTVSIAAEAGTAALAGHQVVNSIWSLTSFALDALAIAAQGLVGQALGAKKDNLLRSLIRTLTWWALIAAVILGAIVAAASPWLPHLFGTDSQMRQAATAALLVAGVLMPISGIVFILDGVLIGAGEGKYLAYSGVFTLLGYLPALAWLKWWLHHGSASQTMALALLWVAFSGWFMLLRAGANAWRTWGHLVGRGKVLGAPTH